eukprot:1169390-Prorocentrum_minimum.AAC.1
MCIRDRHKAPPALGGWEDMPPSSPTRLVGLLPSTLDHTPILSSFADYTPSRSQPPDPFQTSS